MTRVVQVILRRSCPNRSKVRCCITSARRRTASSTSVNVVESAENPKRMAILEQMLDFDEQYYIKRNYYVECA